MNNFLITLKMEFRGRFNLGKNPSAKAWGLFALNLIFSGIIYAIFLVGTYFLSQMILNGSINMKYEFLVVACILSIAVQLIVSTTSLIRVLYHDVDNELLLRFPIDGLDLFLAKAVFVFINNLLISILFTLPFFVYYGVFTGSGVGYYFNAVFSSMFISFLPFFLANLIAVPVMNLNNHLSNKFLLKLLLVIVGLAVGFALYMSLLRGIIEYYRTSNSMVLFSEDTLKVVKAVASNVIPANFFANILVGKNLVLSIILSIVITVVVGVLSISLSAKSYYPTVLASIEKGREAFVKVSKNKPRSHFCTILKTEMLIIFRSFNYSFQYLAMACTAPVMVYLCDELAVAIGGTAVGMAIVPGLTLLVIILFDTIIVSFSATTISRNGENFYFTKIIPINYYVQIFSKAFLYFAVAGASSLVSCLAVWAGFGGASYGNAFGASDVFSIFGISCMMIIILTCIGIISDILSPTFNVNADGELVDANKNVSICLILGVLFSLGFGLFAMVFTFLPIGIFASGTSSVYLVLSLICIGLMLVSVGLLVLVVNRRYKKITPQ